MTKSNRLILTAAVLIVASIIVILSNGMRYSVVALILKVTGLSIFVYALYLQAQRKKNS